MLQNTRSLHQIGLRIDAPKMNRDSIITGVSCLLALIAFATIPAHAQQAGPLTPAAPVTRPAPIPANKPEAPPVPPEEIIRRFAAKEDEFLRESMSYGFQKSVRLEEIGPGSKASGQLEIVTQQFVGPDGRRYEKPVRRSASTLQHLQTERGDS
ncbi:MAG: hypothetical protein JWN92_1252, partial [Candidatus Acidoferrum typicum]|nr:hypothetical protein [Candidatus Acidoferrum typicum]